MLINVQQDTVSICIFNKVNAFILKIQLLIKLIMTLNLFVNVYKINVFNKLKLATMNVYILLLVQKKYLIFVQRLINSIFMEQKNVQKIIVLIQKLSLVYHSAKIHTQLDRHHLERFKIITVLIFTKKLVQMTVLLDIIASIMNPNQLNALILILLMYVTQALKITQKIVFENLILVLKNKESYFVNQIFVFFLKLKDLIN